MWLVDCKYATPFQDIWRWTVAREINLATSRFSGRIKGYLFVSPALFMSDNPERKIPMTTEPCIEVRVARHFSIAPERVFDAWLDPVNAGRWLFATLSGQMVRVEIDARIGGSFILVDRRDGEDVEHVGEYLEIDRPRRLAFTFAVPKFSTESTRVTIGIVASETGCELTLIHEGVLPEYASRTETGWNGILDRLAATLGQA